MEARRWTGPVTGDETARLALALLGMALGLAALALVAITLVPLVAVGWVAFQATSLALSRAARTAYRPWPWVGRRARAVTAIRHAGRQGALRPRRNVSGG